MIPIKPAKKIAGTIHVPGDKSISHRVLFLSALANGTSQLTGVSQGSDVRSTQRILAKLGVNILEDENTIHVEGVAGKGLREPQNILNCGNSGTTARLLLGVLAGQKMFSVLTGDRSLQKRPMKRIVEPLQKMGVAIMGRNHGSKLPIAIAGGALNGIDYFLPVASAQVKTAILLAGLKAKNSTTLQEPAQSRDHMERLLWWLGLPLKKKGLDYQIAPAEMIPNFDLHVPGDFSSAAYFIALGALHQNAEITIRDVNLNETRTGLLRIVERMGAAVRTEIKHSEPEPVGDIIVSSSDLHNVNVYPEEIPSIIDELPLLAMMATQSKGVLQITGAQELRVKETDRIHGIVTQLKKMKAKIEELPDGFIVEGPSQLRGCRVTANGDHRMAMSLTIAALLAEGDSNLVGEKWAKISFPGFYQMLSKLVKAD